jgi:hypothetical protein
MHPIITGMLVEERLTTLRAEAAAHRRASFFHRRRQDDLAVEPRRPSPPSGPVRLPEQRGSRPETVPDRERVGA